MSFSTSKKGLWHILVGLHRLIALHISHAMCKDTVAGRNDKMPTYYASSIAAASFLLLLAVAPALCNSPNRKAHPAGIASALPPVLQATAVLVSPVCVGRSEVVGGDRRWRHRAAAAAVVLRFVQATKRCRYVCHTRTMALETVIASDDLAQNVFCGPDLHCLRVSKKVLVSSYHIGFRV